MAYIILFLSIISLVVFGYFWFSIRKAPASKIAEEDVKASIIRGWFEKHHRPDPITDQLFPGSLKGEVIQKRQAKAYEEFVRGLGKYPGLSGNSHDRRVTRRARRV